MPRAGLDRAAVVAAAAALADAEGIEAVTFARLAEQFGVRPPSLYNHVAGMDGLRRELTLLGLREMTAALTRAVLGKAGDDAVMALADAYRAYARRRPGVYAAALVRAPTPGDVEEDAAATEIVGIIVAALAAYGLTGDDAIHAVRGLRSLLHGFVALEIGGGFGIPLDLEESYHRLVRTFIAGLRTPPAGVRESLGGGGL
jgi:AcrR family transcriptional regulator